MNNIKVVLRLSKLHSVTAVVRVLTNQVSISLLEPAHEISILMAYAQNPLNSRSDVSSGARGLNP